MAAYSLRAGAQSDLPSILDIYNHEILTSTGLFEYETKDHANRENWFLALEKDGYPLLVAVEEGTGDVVGYASLGSWRSKPAYSRTVECSLYVHKDHRNRGLGRTLMEAIIDEGRKNGYHTIIAGITSENELSIRLFSKLGFRIVGIFSQVGWKFGRWLDVTFMELLLE